MKLTHKQALNVLGLNESAKYDDIKIAYRKACSKYHPDRNAGGLEMMKIVNSAYQALSDYVEGSVKAEPEIDDIDLGEELNTAINAIIHLGLDIEVCGTWIWVSGDTKPHKEVLKLAGYKWAPKKMLWHWRPEGSKSWSRGKYSMDEIRASHGSTTVKPRNYTRLSA